MRARFLAFCQVLTNACLILLNFAGCYAVSVELQAARLGPSHQLPARLNGARALAETLDLHLASVAVAQHAVRMPSQRSLHNAPIFRLLLKAAVNGTHQCDFLNF